MNVNKSFVNVDEIKIYHSLSNVLYMLAPITGGITAIPAVIVDVILDDVLDDIQEKMTIKTACTNQ